MLQVIRRSFPLMLFVCLAMLGLTLTACGGGSSSASTQTSTQSSTSAQGSTSSSAPAATVNIRETKGANDAGDQYRCDPTTLTVKKGDSVTFTNLTDETQDFSQSDEQKAGVDILLKLNQSSTVTFNTTGTFMLQSSKNAQITVTVQ